MALLAYTNKSVETRIVPDYGGTYTEGVIGTPKYINPLLATTDVDLDLSSLIFSGLTQANEKGDIVPDIAERWTVSDDGRVWTFVLRQAVKWHDGYPFTVDDVVFTLKAIQDPGFSGNRDLAALWKNVTIEKANDTTVRLTLKEPYTPFLNYTTIGILPAHKLSKVPVKYWSQDPFNASPVGTGRFKLNPKDIDAQHVVLEVNEDYYFERPYLGKVQLRFFPDYQAILSGLKQREVQGVSYIPPDQLTEAQQNQDLKVYSAQLSNFAVLFLNLRQPIFAEKEVRQAMSYGVNRQVLVEKALQGQGLASDSPIPPTSWAYKPTTKKYGFDPSKAKSLLDQAGWVISEPGQARTKEGKSLTFTLVTNDDPSRVKLAQGISEQLRNIGVVAEVKVVTSADLIQKYLAPRNFEVALFGWQGLPNDPDSYQLWHSTQSDHGLNFSGFANQDVDKALETARQTLAIGERVNLYGQFQDIFADEVPSLILYYPRYNYAIDKSFQGVQLSRVNEPSDRFQSIANWYVKTKKVVIKTK